MDTKRIGHVADTKRIKDGPRFLGGQSLFALRLDDSKIRGFQHRVNTTHRKR